MNSKKKLIEFYQTCVSQGVSDIDNDNQQAKAEQIAKSINIDLSKGLKYTYFNAQAQALENSEEKKIKAQKAAEKKQIAQQKSYAKAEAKWEQRNNKAYQKKVENFSKYSDLYGNDKPIQMIEDEYDKLIKESAVKAANLEQELRDLNLYSRQYLMGEMERDWATLAGVANGIAGPAAGLATALEVQRENEAIRARNAATMDVRVQMYMNSLNNKSDLKSIAEKARLDVQKAIQEKEAILNKLKLKIVGPEDDREVFKSVIVNNIRCQKQANRFVKVTCDVTPKSPCKIYGTKDAYIDGSFLALIFQDKMIIGTADMVLPSDGMKQKVELQGLSLCNMDVINSRNLKVKIIPKNLWKMEA